MRAASTAAIAQATHARGCVPPEPPAVPRGSSLESRKPRIRYCGSRMTAAATTGPNSEPRPTSSTPATKRAPSCHTFFSNFRVQCSLFSRRSLTAEAESGFAGADVSFGDTETEMHSSSPTPHSECNVENRLLAKTCPPLPQLRPNPPEGNHLPHHYRGKLTVVLRVASFG